MSEIKLESIVNYLKEREEQEGKPYIDCIVWIGHDNPITNAVPKLQVFYRYCHTKELREKDRYPNGDLIQSDRHQMLNFMCLAATQKDLDELIYLIENKDVVGLRLVNFFEGQPMVKTFEDIVKKEIEKRNLAQFL